LCLRRMLAEGEKDDNTKISRDVASTFERVADAESMLSERPRQEEALIASLHIRRELVNDDEADSGYAEDLAATYEKLGEFYGTGAPTAENASRSTEFSAAFYQAALSERRRASDLRGDAPVARKNLEAAKGYAEQSLAAAKAGGMFADVSGGWSKSRIHAAESQVATPKPVDSAACIAMVTQAARAAAPPSVAKLNR
jgi:hypothetical protein